MWYNSVWNISWYTHYNNITKSMKIIFIIDQSDLNAPNIFDYASHEIWTLQRFEEI